PPAFIPLETAIDAAFRYKTQFRDRSGRNIGFTPEICVPSSNAIPYCYDPEAISEIKARIDCLVHVFDGYYGHLTENTRSATALFLKDSFGYAQVGTPPITYDGF